MEGRWKKEGLERRWKREKGEEEDKREGGIAKGVERWREKNRERQTEKERKRKIAGRCMNASEQLRLHLCVSLP